MSTPPKDWMELGRLAELGLQAGELTHELRQPVFAIKALAQLAANADGPTNPHLQPMLDQVAHLELLLQRAAVASRRAGQAPPVPVPLVPSVRAGVALLQPRARSLQRALSVEADNPATAIRCDPVAVQQIITNLVANGLDASRSRVDVRIHGATVTVDDDGPGIAHELRARIFEPFFTTKPPGKGTGLGLAIARQLAEQHGGGLTIEDRVAGTRLVARFQPWAA